MVFAGTAARGSAIGTATVGMVSYLEDIDSLSVNNGTDWTTDRTIQVFAGTAARSSAIPTPVEGMYAHLNDTDELTYYDGSAWANAGASSGLELITNFTASGVSSININGCFSATYDNYKIMLSGTLATNGDISYRMRNAGTTDTGAFYDIQHVTGNNTALSGERSSAQTSGRIGTFTTGDGGASQFECFSPFLAKPTFFLGMNYNPTSAAVLVSLANKHRTSSSQDSLTLLAASNMTISGSIYGYSK
jgi:hypothetical protein